ncbi:Hypothetical predicted protein [Cloeon dipterum]|uniref:HIG1 domain-containing protein n=1 Tax=Cloeon dipterum TaxID=197152 RepID=A0A8S1CVA0_9INSE|nr:Hypothetical predicted protein [Cloeon dipterum]
MSLFKTLHINSPRVFIPQYSTETPRGRNWLQLISDRQQPAPRFPSTMPAPAAKFAPTSPTFGDESQGGRLQRKIQEAPLFPIGIVGLLGALGYGAYSYKKRGNMSTSVFLMQLRQSARWRSQQMTIERDRGNANKVLGL